MKLKIKLSYEEMEEIRFVSSRYTSGELLYDGLKCTNAFYPDDPLTEDLEYEIDGDVICNIYYAIPEDGGSKNPLKRMIPCIGGTLAEKLKKLFNQVWYERMFLSDREETKE